MLLPGLFSVPLESFKPLFKPLIGPPLTGSLPVLLQPCLARDVILSIPFSLRTFPAQSTSRYANSATSMQEGAIDSGLSGRHE